jgi:hypothetical protein
MAHSTTYILLAAPPKVIGAAYKTSVHLPHPEWGGNTHTMKTINAADQLRKEAC